MMCAGRFQETSQTAVTQHFSLSKVLLNKPNVLLSQTYANARQIRAPSLLVGWHILHMRVVRLQHQAGKLIALGPRFPGRRARQTVSVRIEAADKARPVALHDSDDGVV